VGDGDRGGHRVQQAGLQLASDPLAGGGAEGGAEGVEHQGQRVQQRRGDQRGDQPVAGRRRQAAGDRSRDRADHVPEGGHDKRAIDRVERCPAEHGDAQRLLDAHSRRHVCRPLSRLPVQTRVESVATTARHHTS